MSKVWLFDLDGTIVEAARFYGYAMLDFTRLMMAALGWRSPRWLEIAQLADRIDYGLVEHWGAARDRFPAALTECYRRLCKQVGAPYDEGIALAAWEIGSGVFESKNYTPELMIPGAVGVLDRLQARGDQLYIVTKGDPVVQRRKWLGCGLRRWFPQRRFIVVIWDPARGYPGDKTPVLREIREWFPSNEVFMVGDSVENDIIPAVRAGITGVHIPAYWRWGGGQEAALLPPGAIRLKKIEEIVEII